MEGEGRTWTRGGGVEPHGTGDVSVEFRLLGDEARASRVLPRPRGGGTIVAQGGRRPTRGCGYRPLGRDDDFRDYRQTTGRRRRRCRGADAEAPPPLRGRSIEDVGAQMRPTHSELHDRSELPLLRDVGDPQSRTSVGVHRIVHAKYLPPVIEHRRPPADEHLEGARGRRAVPANPAVPFVGMRRGLPRRAYGPFAAGVTCP